MCLPAFHRATRPTQPTRHRANPPPDQPNQPATVPTHEPTIKVRELLSGLRRPRGLQVTAAQDVLWVEDGPWGGRSTKPSGGTGPKTGPSAGTNAHAHGALVQLLPAKTSNIVAMGFGFGIGSTHGHVRESNTHHSVLESEAAITVLELDAATVKVRQRLDDPTLAPSPISTSTPTPTLNARKTPTPRCHRPTPPHPPHPQL